jgi:ketosteroid isomerase-like protein
MVTKIAFAAKFFILCTITLLLANCINAQEKKVAATSKELYNEIAIADSILFGYFNTKDFEKFKAMFTADLEWFQDNGGLITRKKVFENFKNAFGNVNKLTRQLVAGSLEVHPLKNYGAIEIGVHQFKHIENGKEEIGTFKFLMIWQKKNEQWKIARVVSYDH